MNTFYIQILILLGHSMVVDPWAKVIKSAAEGEETIVVDLGLFL